MEWISNWIQGIIIAVIIGTIIEMILPEGSCKKYVKVVIGVYILFSIISPVITKITGNEFRVSDVFDLDKYIEASNNNVKEDLNESQANQIQQLYKDKLKNDIKEKIESKGYDVSSVNLEVANDENYTLKSITINVTKKDESQNTENNEINQVEIVEKVEINLQGNSVKNNESNEKENENKISDKEKEELKEYISGVYEIDEKNININ